MNLVTLIPAVSADPLAYLGGALVALGMAATAILGSLIGGQGLIWSERQRRRLARELAEAEGRRALADAQRAEAMEQLAAAEQVIAETAHAVHRAGESPDLVDDPGTTALMDAVTDDTGRALGSAPAGRHHAQQDDDEPWPCRVATTNPLPALPGAPLYCEHPDGRGHDGEHFADVLGNTHTWAGGAE